jgi:hypothetical protein
VSDEPHRCPTFKNISESRHSRSHWFFLCHFPLPFDRSSEHYSYAAEGYFQAMQNFGPSSRSGNPISPISPLSQDVFQFEADPFPALTEWNFVPNVPLYGTETVQWSSSPPQQPQDFQFGQSSTSTQIPWTPQLTTYDGNADTGGVAFGPDRGPGYDAYVAGQEFIDTRQRDVTPTAVSSLGDDSDYEGWQTVNFSSYANSSIPSQGSPHSMGSPFELIDTPHQTPSPRPHHNDHQHVFTLYPGITKPTQKLPRGRQRALTTKEKKEAREVREAKACWACHLSKIKVRVSSPRPANEDLPVAVLSVLSWIAMQEVRRTNGKATILSAALLQ